MSNAQRLSGTELQRLSRASGARGLADVAATWLVIFGSACFADHERTWWALAGALVIIASRQAALANLAHDAWHRLCLPSRRANDFVGAWLYSYPIGIPFFHDRRRHLKHHRRVGHDDDPDWVNYSSLGRETASRVALFFLGRLTGSLLWSTLWSALVTRKPRIALDDEPAKADEPKHEMLRVAACQLLLVTAFGVAFSWWSYALYWLLPLATLTAFCNNVRAFVEHMCVDPTAQPSMRLRDIDATFMERIFFSPAHFHFHALHHVHPSIPHYRLARAKRILTSEAGAYPYRVLPGYLRALRTHVAALRSVPTQEP